jgi:polysaccharide pyruvyl transferase WcaK-like protein
MARGRATPNAPRIVVFGNYGNGNLGDEATLQALLELVRIRLPEAEIVAFAMGPTDTAARHGVATEPATRLAPGTGAAREGRSTSVTPSAARRRFTKALDEFGLLHVAGTALGLQAALGRVIADPGFELRCFRTLRRTDLFVVGGGGQLSEPTRVLSSLPLRVLKMTLLARLAGARVLVLNVGAAPLERRSTRMAAWVALRLADYRAFRDEPSRACAARLGAPAPLHVYPDLAYGLNDLRQATPAPGGRTVAVNVFPHYDGRYLPAAACRYQRYLETLASLTARLLERGYRIVLFPTQLRADPPAIADLKARLAQLPEWATLRQQVVEPDVATVGDLIDILGSSDVVVSTRFHGALLALALGRPVLALASSAKTTQAMQEMGQSEFAFNADDANADELVAAFERLEERREAISVDVRRRALERAALLAVEFDSLFGTGPAEDRRRQAPARDETVSGSGESRA